MCDSDKALYRLRRDAMHGECNAQYELARYYEEADTEQAVFWFRKAAAADHEPAKEKCRELGIVLEPAEPKKSDLRCRIFPRGSLTDYVFVVVCSYYKGSWILSRHAERDTWENQGGHIEEGETPLKAAVRELYEESGISDADVRYICDYWGFNARGSSNGAVFFADVHRIGEMPESEMSEIGIFETLPEELTYPGVTPVLIREADQYRREHQSDATE